MESECHADSLCSWCKASAVPDVCHSVENAKHLPEAVFSCDNLGIMDEEFTPRGNHEGKHHGKGRKGHHGKGKEDHHMKGNDGHHKHHERACCMKYAGIIYAITLFFHLCNLRCFFHKLTAWEAKRVEAGEVLSDDGPCGPWGRKH